MNGLLHQLRTIHSDKAKLQVVRAHGNIPHEQVGRYAEDVLAAVARETYKVCVLRSLLRQCSSWNPAYRFVLRLGNGLHTDAHRFKVHEMISRRWARLHTTNLRVFQMRALLRNYVSARLRRQACECLLAVRDGYLQVVEPPSPQQEEHHRPKTTYNHQVLPLHEGYDVKTFARPDTLAVMQQEQRTCVVCMENLYTVIAIPCMHVSLCNRCAVQCIATSQLAALNDTLCPICKTHVFGFHTVYLA